MTPPLFDQWSSRGSGSRFVGNYDWYSPGGRCPRSKVSCESCRGLRGFCCFDASDSACASSPYRRIGPELESEPEKYAPER